MNTSKKHPKLIAETDVGIVIFESEIQHWKHNAGNSLIYSGNSTSSNRSHPANEFGDNDVM